jgi:DNA repair exonuclease SbcCD nuclease subunit
MSNFGRYAEQRRQEIEVALRRAIDHAIERDVDLALFAGDLFDSHNPDRETVNVARRELARLREAGIRSFGVPGTHDSPGFADSVYRREDLPFDHFFVDPDFANPVTLDVDGHSVTVYGIAYDRDHTSDGWRSLARRDISGIHIAIAHAACQDNPGWSIPADDLPFTPDDLARLKIDYVALGHYHNLRFFHRGERVIGAYSGSIEGRNWKEIGERHVVLIEWDSAGSPPAVTPLPIQARMLETVEIDVGDLSDSVAIAAAIRDVCEASSIWRVTLTGDPDFVPDAEAIVAELEARYGYIEVHDATTLVTSQLLAERRDEETVRGEFFRRLLDARERAEDERSRAVVDRAIKLGVEVFG